MIDLPIAVLLITELCDIGLKGSDLKGSDSCWKKEVVRIDTIVII